MKEQIFDLALGKFRCRQFTNVDPEESGVDIFDENVTGGEHIGQIFIDLPNEDDPEAVEKFQGELVNWVHKNE